MPRCRSSLRCCGGCATRTRTVKWQRPLLSKRTHRPAATPCVDLLLLLRFTSLASYSVLATPIPIPVPRPLLRYGFVPQNPLDPIAGPHARRADPIHVPILLARHAPAASSRPRPDRSRNAGGGCGWGLAGGDGEGRRRGLARRVLPHMPSARLRPR